MRIGGEFNSAVARKHQAGLIDPIQHSLPRSMAPMLLRQTINAACRPDEMRLIRRTTAVARTSYRWTATRQILTRAPSFTWRRWSCSAWLAPDRLPYLDQAVRLVSHMGARTGAARAVAAGAGRCSHERFKSGS